MEMVAISHIPVKPFKSDGTMNYYRLSDGSIVKREIGWRGNKWSEKDTYYEVRFSNG